jgi:hypothetical protein
VSITKYVPDVGNVYVIFFAGVITPPRDHDQLVGYITDVSVKVTRVGFDGSTVYEKSAIGGTSKRTHA